MASQQRSYKKFLTAEQRYDLWARMLPGQITQAGVAAEAGADRSVIARLRIVARDGAVAALLVEAGSVPSVARRGVRERISWTRLAAGTWRRAYTIASPDRQSRKYRDAARV